MRWFCSFKSFGDLVIACNVLRNADNTSNGILLGTHLRDLFDVITFEGTYRFIETGEKVPALFDIKKNDVFSILRESYLLRKRIQSFIKNDDVLVFDFLKVRELALTLPIKAEVIGKKTGNVYLDYASYLEISYNSIYLLKQKPLKPYPVLYIFPDSRLKYKNLPDSIIIEVAKENIKHGIKTIIVKTGSPFVIPQFDSIQIEWINTFEQLKQIICTADLVVSSDSLPSHFSEYFSIPVFVFTPIESGYWVPLSSFQNGYFSGFDSIDTYKQWLKSILF